ncbi:alpha/beta hydrolase [Mesorhizobium sp. BR1-1-16]|uniref:alpha/beta fold hydrolase n=1 Tax=Mesorhizobium sp. BR1-1-16 TaxID=2876653 RepID=UPI001CCE1870|nr:alpha/beta hydrolase [Mesorhizobium sp. BR1-1-16]MBZ9939419.1 alpha/beta hydrolase [Mesorhizobium sp. BR1-1-16]
MPDLLNHRLRSGPQGEATLLMVHPLGADLSFWDECVARWGDRRATLAVDLRSAGRSPGSDSPPTLDTHVADLLALLDVHGIDRVVAVGCAMGGAVAVALAAALPGRVVGLVMANPELRLDDGARIRLAERADLLEAGGPEAVLPAAVDNVFAGLDDPVRKARYLAAFRQLDGRRAAACIRGFLSADVTTATAAIQCPTLLVAAVHDMLGGHDAVGAMCRFLPAAHWATLAGASHFGPYQAPAQFVDIVEAFLNALSDDGPTQEGKFGRSPPIE